MAAAPTVDIDPPDPPSKYSRCSPQLDAVVLRAIARLPEGRYPTISAFLEELAPVELAANSHPDRGGPGWKRLLKWGVGMLLLCLLGIVSFLAGRSSWKVFPPSAQAPIAIVTRVVTAGSPFTTQVTSTTVRATQTPSPRPSLPPPPTQTPTHTPMPKPTLVPTPGTAGADRVIAYNPGSGIQVEYRDPQAMLGAPDAMGSCCQEMAQLGQGGSVLLAFTDNTIVDGDGPDFQVYGDSAKDDYLLIEVSADGVHWYAYLEMSEPSEGLDLVAVGLEQAVYVRLTDLQSGSAAGTAVDAVEALHTGSGPDGLPPLPDAVARNDITLRNGPDRRMIEVGQIPNGVVLTVVGRSNVSGWVKVEADSGVSGWCPVADLGLNVSLDSYAVAQALSTPTPPATPTKTATATRRPPMKTPTPALAAPILIEPVPNASLMDRVLFKWQYGGSRLGAGYAFELHIWSKVEDAQGLPRRAAIAPTQATETWVDLPGVPAIVKYQSGDYYWAVVVVRLGNPPHEVGPWSEQRRFTYTAPPTPDPCGKISCRGDCCGGEYAPICDECCAGFVCP